MLNKSNLTWLEDFSKREKHKGREHRKELKKDYIYCKKKKSLVKEVKRAEKEKDREDWGESTTQSG